MEVIANGTVLISSDNGKHWQKRCFSGTNNFYDVDFSTAGVGAIIGEPAVIEISLGRGEQWHHFNPYGPR